METQPNIKLSLDQGLAVVKDLQPDMSSVELACILGVPKAFLLRRSVDARRKQNVHFIVTAGIGEDGPGAVVPFEQQETPLQRAAEKRPVVVGMGPAGLFAALELAEAGLCPLVIERGAPVEERREDVERYHATRILNTASNVQFGEGGAGTFSDGKLTCGKNSPHTKKVLRAFVAAGAPLEILYQAKPHIGTDVLGGVVASIRKRIIACGGEVRFHTQLVNLKFAEAAGNKALEAVVLETPDGKQEEIPASHVVLACGHSARDTFAVLRNCGLELEQKPFSIGVRIEHKQEVINRAQYGKAANHPALGAADYKLSCHLDGGRSVYSFCMCPGGEVVTASSEEGCLCVNGMSEQARAGENSNAALLCNVVPSDFGNPADPLAGIAFQRTWERAAFKAGGGDWKAPAQAVGQFLNKAHHGSTNIRPTYALGVNEADLHSCLPAFASAALEEALPLFDRKLRGFGDKRALMTGIEARSSSPVRIVRDNTTLEATEVHGLYPCGEGAGYAGGIMSAAIDGIRVATAIAQSLSL